MSASLKKQKRMKHHHQEHHHVLALVSLAITTTIFQPAFSLYLPKASSPPSPDIANVGGTVPELVMDQYKKEQQRQKELTEVKERKNNVWLQYQNTNSGNANSGPFFWTDSLGQTSSKLISNQFHSSSERAQNPFSVLSWNILSQQLYEVNTLQRCAKNFHNTQSYPRFSWEQRLQWIIQTIRTADSDIVCLQEVQYQSFVQDLLPAMKCLGYDGVVQGDLHRVQEIKRRKGKGKRAHVVATFWKSHIFQPFHLTAHHTENFSVSQFYAHQARGRTMTSILQHKLHPNSNSNPILAIINCHLEGHPHQYNARIKQLQHSLFDLSKLKSTHSIPLNGLCLSGDFNCELQSSACSTYLRIGRVGRKGGLGGVHGTAASVVPPLLLESEEAAECLHPILEWGKPIPNEEMESIAPHPFRRNSLLSSYPPYLGFNDPSSHFTFCANSQRPVSGLDQIWFSSFSLTRLALRKPLLSTCSQEERMNILWTGLPAPFYPSDHLPIGAVLDWNSCDATMECLLENNNNNDDNNNNNNNNDPYKRPSSTNNKCTEAGIRELIITENKPPPIPKSKSPIMSYAELDMLLVTCPYDSTDQRNILEEIINEKPDIPSHKHTKPTEEQLRKLSKLREKKKNLLMTASEPCRKVMQRILKLQKEVASYENDAVFLP